MSVIPARKCWPASPATHGHSLVSRPSTTVACLRPDWPAPARVHALTTLRLPVPGVYRPGQPFNLDEHAADAAALRRQLPGEPVWLRQVHGRQVVAAAANGEVMTADAIWTDSPGRVCAVLTADCLPLLLCDRAGARVAAVHAGWRGLAAGIIEQAVAALACPPAEVIAWLGPAIGDKAFVVGDEVREAFLAVDPQDAAAFTAHAGRWRADLYRLARQRLNACAVVSVSGGGWCTCSEAQRFYSYRRDGDSAGRHATMIWIDD